MRSLHRLILVCIAAAALSCTAVVGNSVEPFLDRLMEVYAARDAEGLRTLFASDVRFVFPGGELVGPDVIHDQYRLVFSQVSEGETLILQTEVREEWSNGKAIFAWGAYSELLDGEVMDSGYFTLRVVKEGGEWKLSRAFLIPVDI